MVRKASGGADRKFRNPAACLLLSGLCLLLSACGGEEHKYYRAFFLGSDSFEIDGKVFSDWDYTEPADFSTVTAKTGGDGWKIAGWEIAGEKTSSNGFKMTVTRTAGDITLSEDTVEPKTVLGRVGRFPACRLYFYFDDEKDGYSSSYIYVAKADNLSGIDIDEDWGTFGKDMVRHYDYDFNQPGWYKIVGASEPIEDAQKHHSGANTLIRKY